MLLQCRQLLFLTVILDMQCSVTDNYRRPFLFFFLHHLLSQTVELKYRYKQKHTDHYRHQSSMKQSDFTGVSSLPLIEFFFSVINYTSGETKRARTAYTRHQVLG